MLIQADALAQRYGGRPSAFLGVDPSTHPYTAYCVDEAAALAGDRHAEQREAQRPAAPTAAPPARRQQLQLIGGAPVVTGVIERE